MQKCNLEQPIAPTPYWRGYDGCDQNDAGFDRDTGREHAGGNDRMRRRERPSRFSPEAISSRGSSGHGRGLEIVLTTMFAGRSTACGACISARRSDSRCDTLGSPRSPFQPTRSKSASAEFERRTDVVEEQRQQLVGLQHLVGFDAHPATVDRRRGPERDQATRGVKFLLEHLGPHRPGTGLLVPEDIPAIAFQQADDLCRPRFVFAGS